MATLDESVKALHSGQAEERARLEKEHTRLQVRPTFPLLQFLLTFVFVFAPFFCPYLCSCVQSWLLPYLADGSHVIFRPRRLQFSGALTWKSGTELRSFENVVFRSFTR